MTERIAYDELALFHENRSSPAPRSRSTVRLAAP
jgi:hypothetical protein